MTRRTGLLASTSIAVIGASLAFVPLGPIALVGGFLVVVALPGYAAARALTHRDPAADAAEWVAASFGGIGLSCVAVWAAAVTFGFSRSVVIAAPIVAASILQAVTPSSPSGIGPRASRPVLTQLALVSGILVALVALPFTPYGLERGGGVYQMGLSDWYLHLSITTSLDVADSLPPTNPALVAHDHAYYHYGFHLLAAAVDRAAGGRGNVFAALLALTLTTAASFPVVLFVMCRRAFDGDAPKALVAAAAGTLLAGLDLVVWGLRTLGEIVETWPAALSLRGLHAVLPSVHLNHWIPHDERQFNAPYVALIWAPHYVAAIAVGLLCLHAMRPRMEKPPLLAVALLLASLPALSIYVAITMAVAVAAAIAVGGSRDGLRQSPALRRWVTAGVAAVLFAAPVLLTFRRGVAQHGEALVVHVSSAGSWQNGALFSLVFGDHQWTRLLDTPALCAFQFGMVGILGVMEVARRWRAGDWTACERETIAVLVVVFVFLNLVRPPVGGPNNLNFRPMLLVWSLLVPFATQAWLRRERHGKAMWLGLGLCAAAIPYAAAGATLEGALFRPTPSAAVEVLRWINANTPPRAVVAIRPDDHPRAFEYWLRRRVVEAEYPRNAMMLGADPALYESIRRRLGDAFDTADPQAASASFRALGADVVLVRIPEAAPLPWAELPCFTLGDRNAEYAVLVASERCGSVGR